MKLDIPGFRPRVIDDELFRVLDDFRAFRHKFRHSYTFELDWGRERLVARQFPKALGMFQSQLTAFLARLDEVAQ